MKKIIVLLFVLTIIYISKSEEEIINALVLMNGIVSKMN